MTRVTLAGHLARIPVLLALVWLVGDPRRQALIEIRTSDVSGPWPAALELVAVGVAFTVVALWGRAGRQSLWLLAIEGVVALMLALHVSTFGVVLRLSPSTQWVTQAVGPLGGEFGIFFLMPGLAVAWLGLVVWSARRRLRSSHPRSVGHPETASAAAAPPAAADRPQTGKPTGVVWHALRVPLLLAVLWLSRPVRDEFAHTLTAFLGGGSRAVDPSSLWLPGLATAAIMAVFMAALLAGRTRRQPPWLVAIEAVIAAMVPLMAVLAPLVLSGGVPPAWFLELHRTVAPVGSVFLFGATIAWLAVVGWSAVRQLRGRADRMPEGQDTTPATA